MASTLTDEAAWLARELKLSNSLYKQAHNVLTKGKTKRFGQLMTENLKVTERLKSWVDEAPATDLKAEIRETVNSMLLSILNSLGTVYRVDDRLQQSKKAFLRAIDICDNTFGKENDKYFCLLDGLADAHFQLEENAEYEAVARQAIALKESRYGRKHPSVAESLMDLAQACREQGKQTEARAAEAEALEIQRLVYGHDHDEYKIMESSLKTDELLRNGVPLEEALKQVLQNG